MATIIVSNDHDSGAGSLRAAIEQANADAAADVITFASELAGRTITLAAGELAITQALRIDGDLDDDGVADLTISGGGASRIFDIAAAAPTEIEGLVLTNGRASEAGGAVRAAADLVLRDSVISGNVSVTDGGGVAGTDVRIYGSTIRDNKVENGYGAGYRDPSGGGVFASGRILLSDSVVSGNTITARYYYANMAGGGLHAASVEIIGSEISFNSIRSNLYQNSSGGGVSAGSVLIRDSIVRSNRAETGGGVAATTIIGQDADFVDNAATRGGGISAVDVELVGGGVSGNGAGGANKYSKPSGGGIHGGDVDLDGVLVLSNSAGGRGGGVFAATLTASRSVFSDNRTSAGRYSYEASGAGAYASKSLLLTESTVSGNIAQGGTYKMVAGGGMFAPDATVSASTFVGNKVYGERDYDGRGGGLYARTGIVSNSTFAENRVDTKGFPNYYSGSASGGGLFMGAGSVVSTTITGNSVTGYASYSYGGTTYDASGVISGGGIAGGASLTDSIVIGNRKVTVAGAAASEVSGLSPERALGRNLIGADAAAFDATGYPAVENADPTLVFAETVERDGVVAGVVADNGGPTETVALALAGGNPAIDRAVGTPASPPAETDQRGLGRVDLVPGGGVADIGAFEAQREPAQYALVVRAAGEGGPGDLAPRFALRVNGVHIDEVAIARPLDAVDRRDDAHFDDYAFSFTAETVERIEIEFLNDGGGGPGGVNRNLFIDWIELDGVRSETERSATNTVFDVEGDLTFFGREGMFREGLMTWTFDA